DENEGFDPFAWARALENLDLSVSSGDVRVAFSGELELDGHFFGDDPPPGITVEEAALRAKKLNLARPAADSPSDGGKLRLFADYFWSDWIVGSVEWRADHGDPTEEPV